jgi:hypothetical protein
MQSLNTKNAKTYDYMRRSNEVADRILAKTWDKKHTRTLGKGGAKGGRGAGQRAPVSRICSPPRGGRALSPATRTLSPTRTGIRWDSGQGQGQGQEHRPMREEPEVELLNPNLYA